MKFSPVHLGSIVKKEVEDRRKDGHWLGEILGQKSRSARVRYEEEDIRPEYLRLLSQAFDQDLFIHLLSDETKALLSKPTTQPEAQTNMGAIELLQMENKLLHEINDLLRFKLKSAGID